MVMNISSIQQIVVDGLFEILGPICGMNGRTELLIDFSPSQGAETNNAVADFSLSPELERNQLFTSG